MKDPHLFFRFSLFSPIGEDALSFSCRLSYPAGRSDHPASGRDLDSDFHFLLVRNSLFRPGGPAWTAQAFSLAF